jgi:hypothetical protein
MLQRTSVARCTLALMAFTLLFSWPTRASIVLEMSRTSSTLSDTPCGGKIGVRSAHHALYGVQVQARLLWLWVARAAGARARVCGATASQ